MARFEHLMDRRPLLLSSVLLRQNPHNVHEWHKRVKLYEGKPKEIINTYTEAVQTVDAKLASGKPHTLWVEFAKFYEQHGQLAEARVIFDKATKVNYRKVDDLASVWCEFSEMEIRHENYQQALDLMKRATAMPSAKTDYYDESETVQRRVYKSLKLWSMYADLEESLGTFQSTKAVYNRILDLRIATPQIIINFATFLEEHRYFEEAFKGGGKLERARDLFEQVLEGCPAKFAKSFYLMYAKLEENHGLARHAMTIYERSTTAVLPEEQFEMFNLYIKQAAEIFGVTHTREIYEKAIEVLPNEQSREMCIRFADLERKLGEIDRARAVYMHASQMADPRTTPTFWKVWHDFEVRHGNEDTFREMLRIKEAYRLSLTHRSVNFMSAQMLAAAASKSTGAGTDEPVVDDMQRLEQQAQAVAASKDMSTKLKEKVLFVRGETSNGDTEDTEPVVNPEEIDIDEDEDDNEEATYTCRFHFTLTEIGSVWFSFTLLHQAKNDHKSTVLLSDTLNVVKETVDYVLIGKMAKPVG
ncbi:Pre-mRNA-splicing factor SYF1 [Desmophyllum pertusum]|uniref:Pre-mRNA-splicing factor SYF1 n=1 Tax=Desmophyllum pertusum TaxID=174260 RepID=A0A9X0CW23_9CNID|nr:Pre-mRNA-splicing factor SYF1 [Desmophyllum pertusum]